MAPRTSDVTGEWIEVGGPNAPGGERTIAPSNSDRMPDAWPPRPLPPEEALSDGWGVMVRIPTYTRLGKTVDGYGLTVTVYADAVRWRVLAQATGINLDAWGELRGEGALLLAERTAESAARYLAGLGMAPRAK